MWNGITKIGKLYKDWDEGAREEIEKKAEVIYNKFDYVNDATEWLNRKTMEWTKKEWSGGMIENVRKRRESKSEKENVERYSTSEDEARGRRKEWVYAVWRGTINDGEVYSDWEGAERANR